MARKIAKAGPSTPLLPPHRAKTRVGGPGRRSAQDDIVVVDERQSLHTHRIRLRRRLVQIRSRAPMFEAALEE